MKAQSYFILFLLALVMTSCNTVRVTSDYDSSVDFSEYKTYAFAESADELPVNDLIRKRILNGIERNLNSKGLQASDNPDLLVYLGVKTDEKTDYSTTHYDADGYWGRRWRFSTGVSQSRTREINYTEGTLIVNLVDAQDEELLWRASGTETINAKGMKTENLNKAIDKIMSSYPSSE